MTMTTLVGMMMSTYEMASDPFGWSNNELCCRPCPPQNCPNLVVIFVTMMATTLMMMMILTIWMTHCKSLQRFPFLSLISNLAQADLEGNDIYFLGWQRNGLVKPLMRTFLTGIMRPGTKTTFFLVLTSAMSSVPANPPRE